MIRYKFGAELGISAALACSGLGLAMQASRLNSGSRPVGGLAASFSCAVPQLPPSPPIASYFLSARLDAEQHVVHGQGRIEWRNNTALPANELYLHLYLNAFEHHRTLFLRSPLGGSRSHRVPGQAGSIRVRRLVARELGAIDLWPGADPHSPGDSDDRTDIRVPLPSPVAAGSGLTLDVEFESQLPSLVERTGFVDSFHFVAQWFPKLARREPDGTWRHFRFHPQAEFYADFGRYHVTLDVPDNMRLGATGVRTAEQRASGRMVVEYQAQQVHDFAWTAWDQYRERTEQIDNVQVHLLYPPGHDRNARRGLEALRFALPHFEKRYGDYPYATLTVVHPPRQAFPAGGMEYPTLITTGGSWWTGYLSREIEAVTVHELAHQWFYGMLASDESAWPFLDEGLATYAEGIALNERFGPGSMFDWGGLSLSAPEARRVLSQAAGRDDVVGQPAEKFASFSSLGELAYARTATALTTLANLHGAARLAKALHRYACQQRFRHPGPDALLRVIQDELGDSAAAMLRDVLFERGSVDYRVRWLTNVAQPAPLSVASAENGLHSGYLGRALVVRRGTLRLPVDIELVDAQGRKTRQHWDGQSHWTWATHTGTEPLAMVVVDPDRKITLDEDFANNAIRENRDRPWRVLERAAYWGQLLGGGGVP
ncbi:M1 family metallopeptidase [Myxococcota bacterium]